MNIQIDKKDFEVLKNLYQEALSQGENSFIFMGKPVLTSYAKYLIQYLEEIFKNRK